MDRFIAVVLTISFVATASASGAEAPAGPVVLTVAGNVANTNRPAYDEKRDVFLAYHERAFDRAFVFDRAMLEGLGITEVGIEYKDWDGLITFSGPRLTDVLKAAGCRAGRSLRWPSMVSVPRYRRRKSRRGVGCWRRRPTAGRTTSAGEARCGWSSTRRGTGLPRRRRRTCGRGRCSSSTAGRAVHWIERGRASRVRQYRTVSGTTPRGLKRITRSRINPISICLTWAAASTRSEWSWPSQS